LDKRFKGYQSVPGNLLSLEELLVRIERRPYSGACAATYHDSLVNLDGSVEFGKKIWQYQRG